MSWLTNGYLFDGEGKREDKIRKQIHIKLLKDKVFNLLNLYIHHPVLVDVAAVLSSWNTMKYYVIACLSK